MEVLAEHRAAGAPEEQPHGSAGAGAAGSVHDLYLEFAPLLRHIAIRRFGVPSEDADALVHDVFATYLADPTHVAAVRRYLVGGICNASRQYWRRRDRYVDLDEADAVAVIDDRMDDKTATRLDVARALSRIGPRCREALRRHYLDGESTATIAAELDTTRTNVNYLLHVCRKRARAALEHLTGKRCT